jgi:hypothetical protein
MWLVAEPAVNGVLQGVRQRGAPLHLLTLRPLLRSQTPHRDPDRPSDRKGLVRHDPRATPDQPRPLPRADPDGPSPQLPARPADLDRSAPALRPRSSASDRGWPTSSPSTPRHTPRCSTGTPAGTLFAAGVSTRPGACGTARPGLANDSRAGRGARQLPDPYEISRGVQDRYDDAIALFYQDVPPELATQALNPGAHPV